MRLLDRLFRSSPPRQSVARIEPALRAGCVDLVPGRGDAVEPTPLLPTVGDVDHTAPTPPAAVIRTPAISRGPDVLVTMQPVAAHARRLWEWLLEGWDIDGSDPGAALKSAVVADARVIGESETHVRLFSADVIEIYHEMCAELAWAPRSWNVVAEHLRGMTGSEKRYINHRRIEADGTIGPRQKLCIYDIPKKIGVVPLRRAA